MWQPSSGSWCEHRVSGEWTLTWTWGCGLRRRWIDSEVAGERRGRPRCERESWER